jgi:tRNA(Arg) A34 adenosine deaminase TadA
MDDATLLRRAIALAARHSADGAHGPFGAVVARDGVVVGEGWNQVVSRHDPTAHAEVVAIRDAGARLGTHVLEGCTLYASCEPCPLCLAAAYWARIPRVVFAASRADAEAAGFDDARVYEELALPWAGRQVVGERLLAQEGRAVLAGWLANPSRIAY